MSDRASGPARDAVDAGRRRFCGACGERLVARAKFCTACGTRQVSPEQAPAVAMRAADVWATAPTRVLDAPRPVGRPITEVPIPAPVRPAPRPVPEAVPARSEGVVAAPLGRRLVAVLVDGLVVWAAAVVLTFVLVAMVSATDAMTLTVVLLAAPPVVSLVVYLVYSAPLMARQGAHNGQTLGKQLMGLRVANVDGTPIVFGLLGSLLLAIPPLLDALWPLWDGRRQALHDKAAHTIVTVAR
jgi:uncharacterized RDD family membrane protein YckC